MLENRDYMRGQPNSGSFRLGGSASVVLMVMLTVAFAVQCINDVYMQPIWESRLALTSSALSKGYLWQLLTFQFLHVDLWHLLGNLLGLWFFGRFVENALGTKRFLVAYFGAGVCGGLLQCVLMLAFSHHFRAFVYGASSGIAGMFAIFARLQANSEIRWNFILPIRAELLLWITAAISLFFTIVPSDRGGTVAHAAHFGGILAGLAWVRLGWHHDFITLPWERWPLKARNAKRDRSKPNQPAVKFSPWAKRAQPDGRQEEFISSEVDPILDKISAQGIQSLTDAERKILEAARSKMGKR